MIKPNIPLKRRSPVETSQLISRSIIKKFRPTIWSRFTRAVKDYQLVKEGDRIAVCISGGKDSMLLAKCMEQLQRYSQVPFSVEYLVMDPGYAPANRALIEENLNTLGIKAHIVESDIFAAVTEVDSNPCYLCARMRRGHLYHYARELGCNKIALGHHFDDVIETVLMTMLYSGQIRSMLPKLHSTNFPGMKLIRPLYPVRQEDIIAWRDYNHLRFLQCACKLTEKAAVDESASKRKETARIIERLKQDNPFVEINIFKSMHNVHMDTVIEYTAKGERHSFLDDYDATQAESGRGKED
ncbi:MAG: tRNA 2-thiocytidine biosynthesis protein TtcA [Christensenellaceae bacterium]|nr:tRNA 2-thiocytidine biosynthesis protein TtcA [Christensenellaceae bacterium]